MVFATDHVLPFVFQFYVKALASVSIITEVLADDYIAEIAPVTEETARSAKSDSAGGRIACIYGLDIRKLRACLKTIVNRSEFSESNYNSRHHEHFVG